MFLFVSIRSHTAFVTCLRSGPNLCCYVGIMSVTVGTAAAIDDVERALICATRTLDPI